MKLQEIELGAGCRGHGRLCSLLSLRSGRVWWGSMVRAGLSIMDRGLKFRLKFRLWENLGQLAFSLLLYRYVPKAKDACFSLSTDLP